MKRVGLALICLMFAIFAIGVTEEVMWRSFNFMEIVGYQIKTTKSNLSEISEKWFYEYFNQLRGVHVPYDYRIQKAELDRIEVLDEQSVQVNGTIYTSSRNLSVIDNLNLIQSSERYEYDFEIVLVWQNEGHMWEITNAMSPVQYQIQHSVFQDAPKIPYVMKDTDWAYAIQDSNLYVTYDHGETFKEVPNGYEQVCWDAIHSETDEYLDDESYIITPEFTAFIGRNSLAVKLIYSLDQGETWQESNICSSNYKGKAYLSKTDHYCYLTMALDHLMGDDYYGTYRSADFETWESVSMNEAFDENISCVFWLSDEIGYFANANVLYRTTNHGGDYEAVTLPPATSTIEDIGYDPFDLVVEMYQDHDVIYAIASQKEGDYKKDGQLARGLYLSYDGIHFEFVQEI